MFIPADIQQFAKKYALGEYFIHPKHANNAALEEWLKNIQFEQHETADARMQSHSRKRNNLYSFYLKAVDKEVVLKVSQISEHYRWYRKLNLILVSLFKNYSLNAYYGGIALENINVESLKVIAHWTCKRQTENKKSYLMYEKVNASMTVFELCNIVSENNPQANAIIDRIAKSLATTIRTLHVNYIRHGDPHSGNFLVNSPITNYGSLAPNDIDKMRFTLIDLDKTHFSHNEKLWKKKLFDIRCIRRFHVHHIDSTQSLEYYLQRKPKIYERMILRFWMRGGLNLYKWFKRSNKRI